MMSSNADGRFVQKEPLADATAVLSAAGSSRPHRPFLNVGFRIGRTQ
jgi:hypothetical protein